MLVLEKPNLMTAAEILSQLKDLGTEKTRLIYAKQGGGERMFGVKMGDIRTIAKKLKTNHELALELWKTANVEARLLAILIMKPKELSIVQLDEMAKSDDCNMVSDWLLSNVLKDHPAKETLREMWMKSDNNMALRAGWSLTAGRIARQPEGIDIVALLNQIERELVKSDPKVQWTMNIALAYIGINHPALRERALQIGETLGVYRDYPVSKGCTSPFAPIWINEMVSRQK